LLKGILVGLRPRQWIKNLVVFAALLFSGTYAQLGPLERTAAVFGLFCMISGGCYLVNDVSDAENDRRHPQKRFRPVAAGLVPKNVALATGLALAVIGVIGSFCIDILAGAAALSYVALGILYTGWLRRVVLLDVLGIAAGFVIRAIAGAVAIPVEISPWLIVCTVQLSLFLALAKRRCEFANLGADAVNHRVVFAAYSEVLLDQLIAVVTSSTVVAYSLYTISERTIQQLHTHYMPLTIPFVVYGVFRYLYLIHRESSHGQPEVLLLTDRPLLACVALWGLACIAIIALAQ